MTSDKISVLIAVCTCRRISQLAKCLDSIITQAIPSEWQLNLVVVENDEAPTADALVSAKQADAPFPILYRLEPRQGIPFARNCALGEARQMGSDWIIFIDDDETAGADWLQGYADAIKEHAVEVIHGRVVYELPPEDRWAHLLKRNQANERRIDGKVVHSAATNNVIFSARLYAVDQLALEFDTNLRFSGGSDTEFFNKARRAGARIVYSAKPVVYETVPIQRCSLWRLMQRDARVAAAAVYIDTTHYGRPKALRKHARRALQNLFQGLGYLLVSQCQWLINTVAARTNFLKSCLRFARCYGRLLGMRGGLLSPYKTIDKVA